MQYDPNQQPYQPQQSPKKKRKTWLWIALAVIIILFICIGTFAIASQAAKNTTNTVVPTTDITTVSTPVVTSTKPAPAQKWTTTHTFTGNGSKKTGTFSVPDDWKIMWKCTPASFGGIDYNVIITVYNSDGTYADSGVSAICSKAHAHGETEEHQGGSVYLDITSEGTWKISIQEILKA